MQDSWELLFQHMSPQVRFGRRIVESTAVQKRHIMWDPHTLREVCTMLTGDRMAAHADAVIDVASRSISQAIEGFDRDRVGSFVMACSTGYVNPGPDLAASQRAWAAVGFAAHLHRPHGLLCGAQRHQGRHGQRGRTARRAGDLQLHRAQFGPRPR